MINIFYQSNPDHDGIFDVHYNSEIFTVFDEDTARRLVTKLKALVHTLP